MQRVDSLYQEVVEIFHRTLQRRQRMRIVVANRSCEILSTDHNRALPYLKALKHLEVEESNGNEAPADMTILLMDTESAGISMPDTDALMTPREEPRKAFENVDGSIVAALEGEQSALNVASLKDNVAILWLPSFDSVPGYQLATPFRTILNWLLCQNGYQLIHAAAIGFDGTGVLLSGKSGSGKTVASLACLKAGASFVGDDFVIVGPATAGGGTSAYALYNSARLHKEMIDAFALPEPELIDDKVLYFLYPDYCSQLSMELPIKSIFLPRRYNPNGSCEQAAAVSLIREVLVPTVAYLPGKENVVLSNLTKLLSKIPCYSVDVGGEAALIPDILRGAALRGGP